MERAIVDLCKMDIQKILAPLGIYVCDEKHHGPYYQKLSKKPQDELLKHVKKMGLGNTYSDNVLSTSIYELIPKLVVTDENCL